MIIKSLTIENFKCFKTEKTFDFGRITVLTGANSSGKSSVINSLLLVLQSEDFPNSLSSNGDYINLGDFKEISNAYNIKNQFQISFNLELRDNDKGRIVSDILSTIRTFWQEDKISSLPILDDYSIKLKGYLDYTGFLAAKSDDNIDNQYIIEQFQNFTKDNSNYISAFRESPKRTYLEKIKGDYKVGTEGEGYLDQIVEWEKRANGKIKDLVKMMKEMELIEDIKINRLGGGRFEVLVKAFKNSLLTSLSNVGFGISQFLPIMVADLQLPNDSTLFLAEPEIHLHPSVQAKFGDYVVKQINNTEKNYVIETHSEYFLNRIRLAIVKGELKKEDIKIYFLEYNGDDTDVYDVDFKKNGAIKNAPKAFFETYSIDVMDIALNAFAE